MDQPGYGDFRARYDATVWQRLNTVLRLLLGIALILIVVTLFLPRYKQLTQSRAEIDGLQTQVNVQKAALVREKRKVSLLQSDSTYLETIARDRLDLMKEGETVFRLEQPPALKRN